MAAHVPQEKIDDCRELYIRFGGGSHASIVKEMRKRGWHGFTKRNLYARTRGGRTTPGWPERFGWTELFARHFAVPVPQKLDLSIAAPPPPVEVKHLPDNGPANGPARRASVSNLCSPMIAGSIGRGRNRQKQRRLQKDLRKKARLRRQVRLTASAASNKAFRLVPSNGSDPQPDAPVGDDFHQWLKSLPGIWNWDWRHQLYLYHHLKSVTDGSCRRLIISMPPRHGKSELVTVRYAAWRLLCDPSINVIIGSYNQRLADRFSRKIRRVICDDQGLTAKTRSLTAKTRSLTAEAQRRGEERAEPFSRSGAEDLPTLPTSPRLSVSAVKTNENPFPFTRARPANSVSEWETTAGGGLRSVGVGGGVTGFGANLIVIDDPVKSREQASSLRFRERVWDWFNDDLYTRLEPGGAIVLIQTRWHQDDLAGRLIAEMENGGEPWTIVSLPALAELSADTSVIDPIDPIGRRPGEPLCPERFGLEELAEIRSKMTEMSFAALYQQRPVPADGGVFKRAWFRNIVDSAPDGLKWKRGYDLAVSLKRSADYTASFRTAFDTEGTLYIDGGFRRRIDFPEQRRFIIERMRLEPDTEHGIELAIHGRAVMQELRKMPELRGRRLRGVPVRGDKQERALSWIRLAEEGRVRLTRGHWNRNFIEEACSFPFGSHDDQIDAVSIAAAMHEQAPSKLYVF